MAPPAVNIPTLMGPWLVGGMVASFLCGAVVLNSYTYFKTFPKDRIIFKLMVSFLLVVSLLNWGVDIAVLWHYLITGKNDEVAFSTAPPEQDIQLLSPTFVALVAQSFFAHRCWTLSGKNMFLAIGMGIMILFSFGSGLAAYGQARVAGRTYTNPDRTIREVNLLSKILDIWLFGTAATDITISSILAVNLTKVKRGFNQRTDDLVSRILEIGLATASVTSVFAVIDAVVLVTTVQTGSNAHLAFFLQLPHLYAICALYTLNIRAQMANAFHNNSSNQSNSSQKAGRRSFAVNRVPDENFNLDGIRVVVTPRDQRKMFDDESSSEKNTNEKPMSYGVA